MMDIEAQEQGEVGRGPPGVIAKNYAKRKNKTIT
jgi:hypothetical protein|tara:strand:- start:28 stop:129 length:102 start_codon:yes stop_codon:yes gene_type:complete